MSAHMRTKGLLIETADGKEFLLSTDTGCSDEVPGLRLCRRHAGRWHVLDHKESQAARTQLIAGIIDFVSGLCRIVERHEVSQEQQGPARKKRNSKKNARRNGDHR